MKRVVLTDGDPRGPVDWLRLTAWVLDRRADTAATVACGNAQVRAVHLFAGTLAPHRVRAAEAWLDAYVRQVCAGMPTIPEHVETLAVLLAVATGCAAGLRDCRCAGIYRPSLTAVADGLDGVAAEIAGELVAAMDTRRAA